MRHLRPENISASPLVLAMIGITKVRAPPRWFQLGEGRRKGKEGRRWVWPTRVHGPPVREGT